MTINISFYGHVCNYPSAINILEYESIEMESGPGGILKN